ncbi:hypothetical protein FHS94_001000 [Sphingomonas aerophila]|uniref:Uncharacterized protein n=1 Tax=Sphingomonas aerophila TaxID=1344948 RepID=A0A7W9BBJ2_9SPHN|nr:hypothetical protein [Sphingomonas aerophila]
MIDVQQAEVAPAQAPPETINLLAAPKPGCPGPSDNDDVVVCGPRDNEQYRLRPLPPPKQDGFLSRPLRVQLAPGVSFGLQRGGGVGLRAEFGPGKKTDEREEK